MEESNRESNTEPNSDLKYLMLRDVRTHRERVIQLVEKNFAFAENSVNLLIRNQLAPNFLKKLEETNKILQSCCLQLGKLAKYAEDNLILEKSYFSLKAVCLTIPLQHMCYDKQYAVELLYHGTPDRFWLQLAKSSNFVLENELSAHYNKKKSLTIEPTVGEFVVFLGPNKIFCRSKVVSILTHDNSNHMRFELVLVDYGGTIITSLDKLYLIEECFCSQPANGIFCNIYGLSCATDCWGLEAVGFFLSCCQSLMATFHPDTSEKPRHQPFSIQQPDYSVTLVNKNTSGELIDIGKLLIAKGFAREPVFELDKQMQPAKYHVPENKTESHHILPFCSPKLAPAPKSSSKQYNPSQPSVVASLLRHESKSVQCQVIENRAHLSLHSSHGTVPNTPPTPKPTTFQLDVDSNSLISPHDYYAIEQLVQPTAPRFQPSASVQESETQEVGHLTQPPEPHRGGPDAQLMTRFFNSLKCAEEPHGPRSLYGHTNTEHDLENHTLMDYVFGAVLESRPLVPFITTGTLTFLPASIISPTHFYVYPIDETSSQLSMLEKRLNDIYSHSNTVSVTRPEVGSCWVTKDRNEQWSRVRVTSLDVNHQTVDVVFVDYGDNSTVQTSKLHPLVKEIINIHCLAVRCRLGGVRPKEQRDSEAWTATACQKFLQFLGDKESNAVVVAPLGKNGELQLTVSDVNGNEKRKTANEFLVDIGEASFDISVNETHSLQTICWKEFPYDPQEWNPMKEDFHSYKNNLSLNNENYDSVTMGYIPKDTTRICRFYLSSGKCYKGIKCDQVHAKPDKHMFTADEQEFVVALPEEALPSVGSVVSVGVSCVNSPFSMYAVLPHGIRDLRYAGTEIDEFETLETLQEAMQKEYTLNFYQHRYSFSPALSEIVAAKSSYDDVWYRGQVMTHDDNDCYVILFLDFGNTEVIHLRDLCHFLPRFAHLPKQAVELFLNGISLDSYNSTEGKQHLIKLVKDKDLVAEVVSLWPHLSVNLYDTNSSHHIDIAEELITLKAVKRGPKYPSKECSPSNTLPG